MAESENNHFRTYSVRKPDSKETPSFRDLEKSSSSPHSLTSRGNSNANRSRSRQLWNIAIEGVIGHEKIPSATPTNSSTVDSQPMGWYDLTKRVMQLSTSPLLATAAAPALHKENWQQRRNNFLSKYSMFSGALKDDVADQAIANEPGTDIEQRSIMPTSQVVPSGSMDSEASSSKRGSIFGMAVTGVRNLLAVDEMPRSKSIRISTSFEEVQEEDEQEDTSEVRLKNILTTNKSNQDDSSPSKSIRLDEHDLTDKCARSAQDTQTESECLPSTTIVSPETEVPSSHQQPKVKKRSGFNAILSRLLASKHHLSKKREQQRKLAEIHESYRSHRPYFTYWVTFVQILVCITSLIVYGHAPLSSTQSRKSSIFKHQKVDLTMNPWFGPYPADLIRLGAKYTPCIRAHHDVKYNYEKQAARESMSGCCIDTVTGHCMQTLAQQCLSRSNLVWHRTALISQNPIDQHNVIYSAVCGLTPETCIKPIVNDVPREDDSAWSFTSVDSKILKWSPDATKWPICLEQNLNRIANNLSLYPHMQCRNIARPCCTGILGDCILTSKEDCSRRRGIYHPRAHLCSQVDCIQHVCGMLEFFVARLPDQVYRFWTVIFIHAGIIHLLITIIFQYTIMRPLEKLAGCIRVMIIYIVSGFVGSLASALFLRDSVQVGPGGGQFAILACYLSELFLGWRSLKRPWVPFFKIVVCLFLLFTVGLLPLVDNSTQLFGFLVGFILNMIVFPDVNYKRNVRRLVVVTTALATTIVLFIVLITLFYTMPM